MPKITHLKAFFSMCFLLVTTMNIGLGQTITLGDGTSINGITTSSPINIWGRKAVCQMVYTAAELTAAGAVSGPINELGFYVTNNPIYNLPDYQIQIKHTTATNAAGFLEGGYTTVKTIASYAPNAGGWDMLDLDTPFNWDGVSNIAIRICFSRVNPSRDPSGQLRVYNTTSGYKYWRNNGGGSACGNVPSITLNTKPQIRFIFQAETTWTGTVNTDWFNASNWSAGVPVQTIDAAVPVGTPFSPNISGGTAVCKTLSLGGDLSLGSGAALDIYEDFINTGNFIDNGGVIDFVGTDDHEIITGPDLTIMNLRSSSAAGLEIVSGNVIIGDELRVNKGLFNTGDALIVRSDALGTGRIDELRTTCTYTLTMTDVWGDGWNGGFITVFEDGVPIGEFAGADASSTETFVIEEGAAFTINYTSGSYENENAYTLTSEVGTVIFSDGTTPSTGDVFSSVAPGCSFSSTVIGDITMERYIDAGETFWRYFASAVENPALSQYLDDFTTAGFPGTPFPDFPFISIYSYDETMPPYAGYVAAASTAELIEVGQGYQVWSGDTITGTEPFLIDLVGTANQGDIALPVTYTPSGTPTEDGWNLVGNPYPSTIDWDSPDWTKVNMANATYIQDPDTENYATYISGAAANGGSRYIASQQSFWVHAIFDSPQLVAHEGVKSNRDPLFKAGAVYSPGMTIELGGEDVQIDQAVLRHIDGALEEFESEFDAVKLYGGWGENPQLTLVNTEGADLTVHSFDKGYSEWEIPLKTIVFETGVYTLQFFETEEMDVSCLKLEDTFTGESYSIEEEVVLSFEMYDTTSAPRFIIHVGRNYIANESDAICAGEDNGMFELDLDIDSELDYDLIHGGETEFLNGNADPISISELGAGSYTLVVHDFESFCEDSVFTFEIEDATPIAITPTLTNESTGFDGAIELEVVGGTAPYLFTWSNGVLDQNVYGLESGEYSVVIVDANGCDDGQTYFIDSYLSIEKESEKTSFSYNTLNKEVYLYNQGEEMVSLYDINGRLVKSYAVSEGDVKLNIPLELADGVYFIKGDTQNWVYKFVF